MLQIDNNLLGTSSANFEIKIKCNEKFTKDLPKIFEKKNSDDFLNLFSSTLVSFAMYSGNVKG